MDACPKCGQPTEDRARVCPSCGAFVAKVRTKADQAFAAERGATRARGEAVSPRRALARIGVATVAASTLILFGLNRPGTDETNGARGTRTVTTARTPIAPPVAIQPTVADPDQRTLVPVAPVDLQGGSELSDEDWRFLEAFSKLLTDPLARPSDPQLSKVEALYQQTRSPPSIRAALMEGYFRKSHDAISGRRFTEASSALKQLKALNPQEPRIYEFETALRLGLNDWAGTEASSRKYEALSSLPSMGVSYSLAVALSRLDRTPEALSVLDRPVFEICSTGPVPGTLIGTCQEALALKAQLKGRANAEAGKDLFQSNRFNVRFDGETQQGVARDVLFVLDRAYVRLAGIYNHQPRTKIPVVLHSGEDYYTKTGAPRWSGGQYSSHDGRIQIPIRGLPRSLPREMEDTLVHELSHAFVDDMSGGLIPKDLNEGLAQYMEGLRFGDILSASDLKQLATARRSDVMSFYMLSLVMSEQLVRSRGQFAVNDLLLAMRETGSTDGGFRKVLGKPWDAMKAEILETFWRRYS
jgi:hypothetical protein